MSETRYRLPSEVASQLQISPSTLRRWSNEFAEFMTKVAGRPEPEIGGKSAHRRYTDEDLETLMTIKGLLTEGLTYIQVGRRLEVLRLRQTEAEDEPMSGPSRITALAPSLLDASPVAPAVTVLADTLHTVADGQQLLLGSQQANREMMTVILQDNFSLKEENTRLRDRMLELERDLAETRRLDNVRRETLESRLQRIEEQIRSHGTAPRASERSGCLGQFFPH